MLSEKIKLIDGKLIVPENPIIPFIEGDGTGPDIWKASVRVFDAAVNKSYNGKRKVIWKEVLAGEKAYKLPETGCLRRHWQVSGNILLGLKVLLQLRSERECVH